ncbi:MAG TPA: antibiotic biosynthesis monooxygenase [Bacteroidales bacterium]|nr:antibiotic biosynthesis monooxygenase [Bacteroidales bacterium]
MIVTCVYIHVKADDIDKFIRATTLNHTESVREPGNLRFDFIQLADDPTQFMLYEAYESEEAALMHKHTRHYLAWKEAVEEMMAEPRKGVRYTIIQPERNHIL